MTFPQFTSLTLITLAFASAALAADAPKSTQPPKPELFLPKPGEFPPTGSDKPVSGELIELDHVNRTGTLRLDRDDTQRRGDWDRPVPFALLPYATVRYHGAPAELRDIPIGTHLRGSGFPEGSERDRKLPPHRVLRLDDDFSFAAGHRRAWRVDAVNVDAGDLTVTGVDEDAAAGHPDPKPTVFKVGPTTRVFRGRTIATLQDVAAGQRILLNLTVAGLKGPGRCTDLWLDPESRELAAAQQREAHRLYQREHGLPGYVDEVDNKQGIVTVTLFAGFDPALRDDFAPDDVITGCVAEDNLRTWDQINDRKAGPLVEMLPVSVDAPFAGMRLRFKPSTLLEGFRPHRIVRLFPAKWKVDDLPKEERLYQ